MEFNFLKLVFTLTLADDIDAPYLLFGIRTDFAEIFRRVMSSVSPLPRRCAS
jgi:hypothetical protein